MGHGFYGDYAELGFKLRASVWQASAPVLSSWSSISFFTAESRLCNLFWLKRYWQVCYEPRLRKCERAGVIVQLTGQLPCMQWIRGQSLTLLMTPQVLSGVNPEPRARSKHWTKCSLIKTIKKRKVKIIYKEKKMWLNLFFLKERGLNHFKTRPLRHQSIPDIWETW